MPTSPVTPSLMVEASKPAFSRPLRGIRIAVAEVRIARDSEQEEEGSNVSTYLC